MNSAPPVVFPVGRFVWSRRIATVLALGSAFPILVLLALQASVSASLLLMGVAWLLAVALSLWFCQREALTAGDLSWDGQSWWHSTHGGVARPVKLGLVWDGGRILLLSVRARGAPTGGERLQFACLQAGHSSGSWHALRCAVHDSARHAGERGRAP